MERPPLKWVGGKKRISDEIISRFPQEYGSYHEPFIGGGAIYFQLEPGSGSINDLNARLVNYYRQVRDNPESLIAELESFRAPLADKDPSLDRAGERVVGRATSDPEKQVYYYQQRDLFNKRVEGEEFDNLKEAARLQYLTRNNFGGVYRENLSGEYNVGVARPPNNRWVYAERIREASDILAFTTIYNTDFEYVTREAMRGDIVYLDPPYVARSSEESFTSYTGEGFGQEQQRNLLSVIETLDQAGVNVIVSNSGVVADKYTEAGLQVDILEVTRPVNADTTERGTVEEVIATNVPKNEQR